MDKHFATAPVAENMPILAALTRIWNTPFLGRSGTRSFLMITGFKVPGMDAAA